MKFVFLLLFLTFGLRASASSDDWPVLRISDHPKARGLDFSIRHPSSWIVKEGNHPHIVKKLTKENSVFMILVQKLPVSVSREDANDMFSQEDIKEMMPDGSQLVSCKKTKLERQTAWLVIYSFQLERLGIKYITFNIMCVILYRNYMLQMMNMFALPDAEFASIKNTPVFQKKYDAFILESLKVFNTLIIYNEYQ